MITHTFVGLSRNEAIECVRRRTIVVYDGTQAARLAEAYKEGMRAALESLADAGAFNDGRNMHDRLPARGL